MERKLKFITSHALFQQDVTLLEIILDYFT